MASSPSGGGAPSIAPAPLDGSADGGGAAATVAAAVAGAATSAAHALSESQSHDGGAAEGVSEAETGLLAAGSTSSEAARSQGNDGAGVDEGAAAGDRDEAAAAAAAAAARDVAAAVAAATAAESNAAALTTKFQALEQRVAQSILIAVLAAAVVGTIAGIVAASALASDDGGDGAGGGVAPRQIWVGLEMWMEGYKGAGNAEHPRGRADMDGVLNPTVVARPGDTVTFEVTNGDAFAHDLVVQLRGPTFQRTLARTATVTAVGDTVTASFVVPDDAGTDVSRGGSSAAVMTYHCSVEGHRASMEGFIRVSPTLLPPPARDVDVDDIRSLPTAVPPPIASTGRTQADNVTVYIESREVVAEIEPGVTWDFWTFNGTVPGPMIRVLEGDLVTVVFSNAADSSMPHNIDFHAATGPGGGGVPTELTNPGTSTAFRFRALWPGAFVYHCVTRDVPTHISRGMYGTIMVDPLPTDGDGGGGEGALAPVELPPVDVEWQVAQGEMYTSHAQHTPGHQGGNAQRMHDEEPTYVVFNGRPGAAVASATPSSSNGDMVVSVGQTARIYLSVGGPNLASAFHVVGEVFDTVYMQGSVAPGSVPLRGVQTVLVAPGSSTIVDIKFEVPGEYVLVDHAMGRSFGRGAIGTIAVTGDAGAAGPASVFAAVDAAASVGAM